MAERLHCSRSEDLVGRPQLFRSCNLDPRSLLGSLLDCRLDRVALYAIHVFGTFPPLAASWRMTSLWSQTFIFERSRRWMIRSPVEV